MNNNHTVLLLVYFCSNRIVNKHIFIKLVISQMMAKVRVFNLHPLRDYWSLILIDMHLPTKNQLTTISPPITSHHDTINQPPINQQPTIYRLRIRAYSFINRKMYRPFSHHLTLSQPINNHNLTISLSLTNEQPSIKQPF